MNSRLSTLGWPSGLEHKSRIQVFSIQAVSCTSYYEICRQRFLFLQVVSRKKEEKSSTNKLPTTRFAVEFFLSYESLKSRKWRIFFADELHTRAVEVREAKEAVESARAGLLPQKGGLEKEKKRKEKDQGRLSVATRRGREKNKKRKEKKKTKEGGLSPQEGDMKKTRKEKKRKEKDQGRQEGGSSEGKVPCALHQEFFFWFTSTWA
jgi:hypothetical protein